MIQGIRELLKEVKSEDLTLALKTASEELSGRFLETCPSVPRKSSKRT